MQIRRLYDHKRILEFSLLYEMQFLLVKTLADYRGWSKIVVRTSEKLEFDKLPGATQNEKLHNLLIAKGPAVPVQAQNGSDEKLLSQDGPRENFSGLDACEKMDIPNVRCLRNFPIKTYKIDKRGCEACQFSGLHYPPDLNGLTPREVNKIERDIELSKRRKEVAELELEKERERTDRAPVRVIY